MILYQILNNETKELLNNTDIELAHSKKQYSDKTREQSQDTFHIVPNKC